MVAGSGVIQILEQLYQRDLERLTGNYKSLAEIDGNLLCELDVNLENIKEALRQKIGGLKDKYWQKLFNSLNQITDRLIHSTRQQMVRKLTEHTHVDFTVSNAYAVVIWVLKNVNVYLDDQISTLVERMSEKACITLYKSNKKTFGDDCWRYGIAQKEIDRYSLDYRIVLHRIGGICTSTFSYEQTRYNGLTERAHNFINDIITVANNIGFDTTNSPNASNVNWETRKAQTFIYFDHVQGKNAQLMEVRAYLNGNLHIKLNQAFIARLNVIFGRLKGWLKSSQEAATELDIPLEEAVAGFESSFKLNIDSLPKLGFMGAGISESEVLPLELVE